MKWGCNYSKALMELLNQGELSELNYIKAGAFGANDLEAAFAHRPLLLHGFGWYERIGMDLTKAEIPKEYGGNLTKAVQRMNELLYYYDSPHVAFHCLAYPEDMADLSGDQPEKERQLHERMKQNILYLKEHLEVPVLIENIDYCPEYPKIGQISTVRYAAQPETIKRLAQETEIGFLFDLSHARVSAEHLGMPFAEYCRRLPMERVKEAHLSGSADFAEYCRQMPAERQKEIRLLNGGELPSLGRIDVHEEMAEEDYRLLEALWQENAPEYITLEYGWAQDSPGGITSAEAIVRQMKRLQEIFSKRESE